MAKIQEEVLVVKLSKLLRDTDTETPVLNEETYEQLHAVLQELAGSGVLVELQPAD